MPLVLGIDTGGTFTDGVILDPRRKQVLCKSKALTTKPDLLQGILGCIDNLPAGELSRVGLVCLSTTLATNAIVEGRKGRTGLILIGKNPEGSLPVEYSALVPGLFDIKGREKELLAEDRIAEIIGEFREHKLDSLAVSGYASVRNPGHEIRVRQIISELWDIPLVCAHELSSTLGFRDRTVTAVLNAGLIPIINGLIDSVKTALEMKDLSSRLMIVKGDGTLMDEASARFRPIETIFSGPAASVMGGLFLSGLDDGVILDMGGTTTDIALVTGGKVEIRRDGALAGGRKTHVKAAEIRTFGMGGDSRIQVDYKGKIMVGPGKVKPLSLAGSQFPNLLDELENYVRPGGYELFGEQEADCFGYLAEPEHLYLSDRDKKLLEILRKGPHSLFYLARKFDTDSEKLGLSRLIRAGAVERISVTPTDLLHVTGQYTPWDRDTARKGFQIMAEKAGESLGEFIRSVTKEITGKLTGSVVSSLTEPESAEQIDRLMNNIIWNRNNSPLSINFSLSKPLVAVGAPVGAWLPAVSEELGGDLCIPEYAGVANAVGAAAGRVMESVEILIRYSEEDETYTVFAPWERKVFRDLETAGQYSLTEGERWISEMIRHEGCSAPEIVTYREDLFIDSMIEEKTYVETRIKITGIGSPEWGDSGETL